jgi:hypothetical protein
MKINLKALEFEKYEQNKVSKSEFQKLLDEK